MKTSSSDSTEKCIQSKILTYTRTWTDPNTHKPTHDNKGKWQDDERWKCEMDSTQKVNRSLSFFLSSISGYLHSRRVIFLYALFQWYVNLRLKNTQFSIVLSIFFGSFSLHHPTAPPHEWLCSAIVAFVNGSNILQTTFNLFPFYLTRSSFLALV